MKKKASKSKMLSAVDCHLNTYEQKQAFLRGQAYMSGLIMGALHGSIDVKQQLRDSLTKGK